MKPIKKFSTIATATDSLNESAKVNQDAVMDLVKKMGYESVEELKKEKNLLSKLEALLKDFTPKQDISEDEIEEDRAEDIEDEVKAKGEPKSLEGEEGEKEEDKEVGGTGEVSEEDTAEEIEDEVLAKGEPKDLEDEAGEKVTDDQPVTDEVPAEGDDEESGIDVEEEEDTPAATRRIMAFEDFIKEKEVTVNKNVKYHDDDEEPEDYAVPVAEEDEEEEIEHDKDAAKDDYAHIEDLKKDAADDKEEEDELEDEDMYHKKEESRIMPFSKFVNEEYGSEEVDNGPELKGETADQNGIVIKVAKGDGSESAAGIAGDIMDMGKPEEEPDSKGEELVTKDQNITKAPKTAKGEADVQGTVVVKEEEEVEAEEETVEEAKVNEKKVPKKGSPDYHQHKIAVDTVRNPMKSFMGGPSSKEAEETLIKKFGYSKKEVDKLKESVNEAEIKSDKEFEEYATEILKSAHGDKFDEAKAKEVIDGLKSKYSGDYGAMVGALQSSMG